MTPSLEARGVVRDFSGFRALNGVDFSLYAGELLTVFGPNGAGKTTLLRILGGGLRPTKGEVRLHGESVDVGDREWRRSIGVVSHQGFLYGQLSARENLIFFGRLFGLDRLEERVAEALVNVGLANRSGSMVRTYSRGMRQRLALSRALLHEPEIVLLDEPYTGLDAHAAGALRELLESLKDGRRTVVLVTHALTQGLDLADKVAIQVRGRFVRFESKDALPTENFEAFYREVVETAVEAA